MVAQRMPRPGAPDPGAVTRWWWVRHAPVPNPEARCYGQLDKEADGFRITQIALTTRASVPNADPAKFQAIAEETKKGCPVSKALAATPITLKATLA